MFIDFVTFIHSERSLIKVPFDMDVQAKMLKEVYIYTV